MAELTIVDHPEHATSLLCLAGYPELRGLGVWRTPHSAAKNQFWVRSWSDGALISRSSPAELPPLPGTWSGVRH